MFYTILYFSFLHIDISLLCYTLLHSKRLNDDFKRGLDIQVRAKFHVEYEGGS